MATKVKIDKDLHRRASEHAAAAGYSSVDEFVAHCIEKELHASGQDTDQDEQQVADRLKGLGYIE
jgi:hypothetical protein